MQDSSTSGKKPIKEVQELRARKPKLERAGSDITDHKRAEKLLRKERDKAQEYLDIAAVMLVAVDVEERVGLINKKGCEILGYKEEEEVIGKNWFDNFLPPGIKHQVRGVFEKLIRRVADAPEYYESLILTKDGDERLIAWHNTVLRDDEGQVIAILSSGEDITERKRAEKMLRETRDYLQKLLDYANTSIIVWDAEFRISQFNNAFAHLTGYSASQVIGQELGMLFPEAIRDNSLGKIARILGGEYWESVEIPILCKNGRIRLVLWNSANIYTEDGTTVIATIAQGTDITERKIAEQKLLDDQAKLKSLASELTLAEERERRRIATDLHDRIGQSLVISKMNLDELRQSVPDEKLRVVLDEVCNSLGQTIDDTRTLTFDLSSPILYELGFEAAVAEWLTEQIQEKHGIATQFEDDGRPKPLVDDISIFLFRDVRELLINVVKHARAKNIKVAIHKVGSRICVSVQDDGVGFDPDKAASTAVKRAKFGLFSIRQRLEELGGHLEIKSEPGRGCKATMTAPLKQE